MNSNIPLRPNISNKNSFRQVHETYWGDLLARDASSSRFHAVLRGAEWTEPCTSLPLSTCNLSVIRFFVLVSKHMSLEFQCIGILA